MTLIKEQIPSSSPSKREQLIVSQASTFVTRHPDWARFQIKRYHKFLKAFEQTSFDLNTVAHKFFYTPSDMLSIFIRINRAFEEHERLVAEAKEKKRLTHMLNEVGSYKPIFEEIFNQIETVDLDKVFPEKLSLFLGNILQSETIEEAAHHSKVDKKYMIERIAGRKSPRKPCEAGARYYLAQSKKQQGSQVET